MVIAIQYLPKELYFPANDSYIQTLYGQTGLPSTRDLILIGRDAANIRKELFNIPTVAVCYRAIYTIRVSNYYKPYKPYYYSIITRTLPNVLDCC